MFLARLSVVLRASYAGGAAAPSAAAGGATPGDTMAIMLERPAVAGGGLPAAGEGRGGRGPAGVSHAGVRRPVKPGFTFIALPELVINNYIRQYGS